MSELSSVLSGDKFAEWLGLKLKEVERKIFLLIINLSSVCWIKTPAKLGPFSNVAWGIFCVSVNNNNCWVRTCQKKKFKIKVRYHFGQVSEWFGVNYWTALRLKTEVLFKTKQKWQRIWQLWWVWSLLFRGQLSCSQQDWKNIKKKKNCLQK